MNKSQEKEQICAVCPRGCKINRNKTVGFCNENAQIRIAKIIEHFKWEEPCITGDKGALAIFCSGCNLRCDYCQNYEISRGGVGKTYSIDEFCKLIEEKQKDHSYIDLITPTHFSDALHLAFSKINKQIPVVWNTNSYETVQNLQKMADFVDIFLADFKYSDDKLAQKFSKCTNYHEVCLQAIKTMCNLKKDVCRGDLMQQGVIIRHLVLPDNIKNSLKVLDEIKQFFPERKLSLMSQFTPNGKSSLQRKLNPIEYKIVLAHMEKLGLTNGYFQEFSSANDCFVPKFD